MNKSFLFFVMFLCLISSGYAVQQNVDFTFTSSDTQSGNFHGVNVIFTPLNATCKGSIEGFSTQIGSTPSTLMIFSNTGTKLVEKATTGEYTAWQLNYTPNQVYYIGFGSSGSFTSKLYENIYSGGVVRNYGCYNISQGWYDADTIAYPFLSTTYNSNRDFLGMNTSDDYVGSAGSNNFSISSPTPATNTIFRIREPITSLLVSFNTTLINTYHSFNTTLFLNSISNETQNSDNSTGLFVTFNKTLESGTHTYQINATSNESTIESTINTFTIIQDPKTLFDGFDEDFSFNFCAGANTTNKWSFSPTIDNCGTKGLGSYSDTNSKRKISIEANDGVNSNMYVRPITNLTNRKFTIEFNYTYFRCTDDSQNARMYFYAKNSSNSNLITLYGDLGVSCSNSNDEVTQLERTNISFYENISNQNNWIIANQTRVISSTDLSSFDNFTYELYLRTESGGSDLASVVLDILNSFNETYGTRIDLNTPENDSLINSNVATFNYTSYDTLGTAEICNITLDNTIINTTNNIGNGDLISYPHTITSDLLGVTWNVTCSNGEIITHSENRIINISFDSSTISNISITPATTYVSMSWKTDKDTNSSVLYFLYTNTSNVLTVSNTTFSTDHSITIVNLTEFSIYYYNITSCNLAGSCITNGTFLFVTSLSGTSGTTTTTGGGGSSPITATSFSINTALASLFNDYSSTLTGYDQNIISNVQNALSSSPTPPVARISGQTAYIIATDPENAGYYGMLADKGQTRTHDLVLYNIGKTEVTIKLACENSIKDKPACDYVSLDKDTITIKPNQLVKEYVTMTFNMPKSSEYGEEFYFNIATLDQDNYAGSIGFRATTSKIGLLSNVFGQDSRSGKIAIRWTVFGKEIRFNYFAVTFVPLLLISLIASLIMLTSGVRNNLAYIGVFIFAMFTWIPTMFIIP